MSLKAKPKSAPAKKESNKKPAKSQVESKKDKAAPLHEDEDSLEAAPAAPSGDADDIEEAEEEAESAGGAGGNAAALAAAGGSEMSASFKNFRHHPDMENFYRFIYENDLRHEALAIIDEIIVDKTQKRQVKVTK